MNLDIKDNLSLKDSDHKLGLRGHVKIELEDRDTKEKTLWYEADNIIPISGMQWVLMKMFGLHLDSVHDPSSSYERDDIDTSTVIPDLNNSNQLSLGVAPENYSKMVGDISADHFIQGFMVGFGAAGEDSISTKNTDYCYIKLKSPIPFQDTSEELDPSLAGKYLGVDRSFAASRKYMIKKFDERAHIYHNWWKDGQKWDAIDPITQNDLGPGAASTPKTNRIETYAEVTMSIDTKNGDCIGFFVNNNVSPVINELGLVAFDTAPGSRSIVETLYNNQIKQFLNVLFSATSASSVVDQELIDLATEISTVLTETTKPCGETHIDAFNSVVDNVKTWIPGEVTYEMYGEIKDALCSASNIEVTAMYNQTHQFVYETDKFLLYLADPKFNDLTVDEAQRIKLITYYTFKSIPLQSNWKILISYRIYAN